MKTKIQILFVLIALGLLSCQKQDNVDTTVATDEGTAMLKSANIAVNDVAVEGVTQEANLEADFYSGYERLLRQLAHFKGRKGNLLEGKKGMHYKEGQMPVVSIDTAATGYPITITIAYNDSVATMHGRVISGTVKIEISAKRGTDGSTRKISYINCKIDSIGINGTSTETFNGDNTIVRKVTTSSDVVFTLADGTIINRTGTGMREWIKGLDTVQERGDDMVQITGSISVELASGDKYTRVITTPLVKLGDCHHPVSGIMQYSQNGTVTGELNYGDGTCDNLAQLTTGGNTVVIELKGKMPKAKFTDDQKHKMGGKDGMGGRNGKGGKGGH